MKLIYIRRITHYSIRVNTHRNIALVQIRLERCFISLSALEKQAVVGKTFNGVIKDNIFIRDRNLTNHSSTNCRDHCSTIRMGL